MKFLNQYKVQMGWSSYSTSLKTIGVVGEDPTCHLSDSGFRLTIKRYEHYEHKKFSRIKLQESIS